MLIVDDDADIHTVSALVLDSFEFEGRRLELLHAHSGREAFDVLQAEQDIAVILLDVVMESQDAGLRLVQRIRGELGNHSVRIILRTGQPGVAPELEVIRDYDINDYKNKSELTRSHLCTAITAALRAYTQLQQLHQAREQQEARLRRLSERGREAAAAAQRLLEAQSGLRQALPPDTAAVDELQRWLAALEREVAATVAACRDLDDPAD